MKLANAKSISRDEWLEIRQKGIGGSDVGSIFGLNKYKSPMQLWLEKTGKIESPNISNKLAVRLGNMLEDTVAQLFTEETGLEVKRNNFVLQHNDYPFMLANIDREGKDKEGKRFILECKTAGSYASKDWQGEDIPLTYELQVMHYLIVTGYDYGYIACLIGNQQFVIKKIELDEKNKEIIIAREKEFWARVENNEMPPVDSSKACSTMLAEMYPEAKNDSTIILDNDVDAKLQIREELKSQVKVLEEKIDLIDNEIKAIIQDNESATTENFKISWKNVTTNRFDSTSFKKSYPDLAEKFNKASVSRRFEIKTINKGE